jgi:hypothetical protein
VTTEDSDNVEGSGSAAADKPARAEKLEQKDRIQELIFTEKPMDTKAIEEYLEGLFSTPDAKAALKEVREQLKSVGDNIRRAAVTPRDLTTWLISSLLNRGSLCTTFLFRSFSYNLHRDPFCGESRDTQRILGQ